MASNRSNLASHTARPPGWASRATMARVVRVLPSTTACTPPRRTPPAAPGPTVSSTATKVEAPTLNTEPRRTATAAGSAHVPVPSRQSSGPSPAHERRSRERGDPSTVKLSTLPSEVTTMSRSSRHVEVMHHSRLPSARCRSDVLAPATVGSASNPSLRCCPYAHAGLRSTAKAVIASAPAGVNVANAQ